MQGTQATDVELLQAWAAGDTRAGEALFERHFESVARFFRNKVDVACDDLVQRTFLGCLEARTRFAGHASFRTFLFGIARNVLGKHLRERYRDRGRYAAGDPELDLRDLSASELGHSASQWLIADQARQQLLTALRRIPIELQLMLELHYWEAMSGSEIAEVVGIPLGTVKTRIRRGRQLLQAELDELDQGGTRLSETHTRLETWARELRAAHPQFPRPGRGSS